MKNNTDQYSMGSSLQDATAKVMSEFYDAIGSAYREKAAMLEGHDITDQMIKDHGQRFIDREGKTTLCWKGIPLVEWDAHPIGWSEDGSKAVITFLR